MNRRWFALVLMMALIPGCSGNENKTAPSEALQETKPTDPVGFSSFSPVFEAGEVLQALSLEIRDVGSFRFLGEDILLFSGFPDTTLTLLDGDTFTAAAEATLPRTVSPEDPGVTVNADGITYVDDAARELVFLDPMLRETDRIPLPENSGQAVLSSDRELLYYCTPDTIRVLNLRTGTDFPLRKMAFPCQELVGLHSGDSVLQCSAVYEDGTTHVLFLSTGDGRLLYESKEEMPLWTQGELYFSIHRDGEFRELLSGSPDFGPSILVAEQEPVAVTPVLVKRLVLLHTQTPEGSIVLDGYHLETGRRMAHLTLPGAYAVVDIQPDPNENVLWLLCRHRETGQDILCRWDLSLSDPNDPRNYLQSRWSRENPDAEGLARCAALAEQLSRKHGVQIHIPTDLSEFSMGEYRFLPEYQVPLLREMLAELDTALSAYPEGFLEELALPTRSGRLNICLVRSIDSEDPGLSYRDDRGDLWLVVTPEGDLTRQINRFLCVLIDSRVLSVSDAYDDWARSDPGDNGHQERVSILETAMQADRSALFASGDMQSALRQICIGIRDAFESARTPEHLIWEQYLIPDP